MKASKFRSGAVGFIAGVVFCSFAVGAYAANTIKTASFTDAKIYFYGQEVSISAQPVVITEIGNDTQKLYFPTELMEYMQFIINWDKEKNTINLTMNNGNGFNPSQYPDYVDGYSTNAALSGADAEALDIMQRTGNWRYIQPYLPKMSNKGIDAVVACYNSKHPNKNEHKIASDYYNK
jgi:hypothetical protein